MNNNLHRRTRPERVLRDKAAFPGGGRQIAGVQEGLKSPVVVGQQDPLLRSELGDVLRNVRTNQGRTLREVSSDAQVSLGYLSEVERGQKEASSELLVAISQALGVPLWLVLREVSTRLMLLEQAVVPDTVPDDFLSVSSVD